MSTRKWQVYLLLFSSLKDVPILQPQRFVNSEAIIVITPWPQANRLVPDIISCNHTFLSVSCALSLQLHTMKTFDSNVRLLTKKLVSKVSGEAANEPILVLQTCRHFTHNSSTDDVGPYNLRRGAQHAPEHSSMKYPSEFPRIATHCSHSISTSHATPCNLSKPRLTSGTQKLCVTPFCRSLTVTRCTGISSHSPSSSPSTAPLPHVSFAEGGPGTIAARIATDSCLGEEATSQGVVDRNMDGLSNSEEEAHEAAMAKPQVSRRSKIGGSSDKESVRMLEGPRQRRGGNSAAREWMSRERAMRATNWSVRVRVMDGEEWQKCQECVRLAFALFRSRSLACSPCWCVCVRLRRRRRSETLDWITWIGFWVSSLRIVRPFFLSFPVFYLSLSLSRCRLCLGLVLIFIFISLSSFYSLPSLFRMVLLQFFLPIVCCFKKIKIKNK